MCNVNGCNYNWHGNNQRRTRICTKKCPGCAAFKKLTHEFEKDVIEAASTGDPSIIPGLLEQYNEDVRALDLATRGLNR